MNPLLQQSLVTIVGRVLTLGAGYLVAKGIWSPEDASSYVLALAVFLVTTGWSMWQKYSGRIKLLTALSSSHAMSENQLTKVIALGDTPAISTPANKVPKVVVVWLLAAGLASASWGCAKLPPNSSPEAQLAVRGDQVVHALRQVLPALKPHICQASVPPPCLTPADADRLAQHLEQAFGIAGNLAKALEAVDRAKTAREHEAGMGAVRAIVRSLTESVALAQIAPAAEPARLLAVQILSVVTLALFALGGL